MKKINAAVAFPFIGFLAACTTTGYKPLPLTPLDQLRVNQGTNSGFVEDAIPIQGFNLFPDSISSKIETELTGKTDKAQALRNVQASICDGRKPRVQANFSVVLVPPKPQAGISLDQANAAKARFLKLAREYIQNRFLDDASDTELTDKKVNDEFQHYQECMVSPDSNRKCGPFSAVVTTVPSNSIGQLIEGYRKLAYTPTFNSFGYAETIYHWRSQFMAVVFPRDRLAILTPKVATGHFAEYTDDGSTFLTSRAVTPDHSQLVFGRSASLPRHVHFIPSKYGYRINDTVGYPLMKAVMRELAYLKSNFSFVLPREVVPKLVDLDIYGKGPHVEYQYFGYDPETDKFSPAYAIKHADHIWTQYLKHQTSIAEAVQPDETVRYELSLDLSMFCAYAMPISELSSH